MTTALSVSIAGVEVSPLGWIPETVQGRLSVPERSLRSQGIPARAGVLVTGLDTGSRTLVVSGILRSRSVLQRALREQAVTDLLMRGLVRVMAADDAPARLIHGYTQKIDIEPLGRGRDVRFSRVSATLLCPDPVWRAVAMTGIALPTPGVRVALPLGSASSDPVIHLMGPATNPVFTLRDGGGTPLGVPLAFSVGLGATEYLEIDMRRGIIDRVTAGVRDNGADLISGGTFPFPLDPRRGVVTAEVSSGTAQVRYVRGWR